VSTEPTDLFARARLRVRSVSSAAIVQAKTILRPWTLVEIGIKALASLVLVLVSLRQFLFTPGYYVYADQFWPLQPNLPNSQSFGPLLFTNGRFSATSFPFFTRDLISWPSLLFGQFSPNYQASIRAFDFYTFLLFVFASWILARLITNTLEGATGRRLDGVTRGLLQFFIVIVAYSNAVSIELNADGGTLADGLILLMISAMILLTATRSRTRDAVAVAVLLSFTLLLDPDYYLICVIVILTAAFAAGLFAKDLRLRFRGVVIAIVLSLPVLLFVFVGLSVTGPPGTLASTRSITQAASLSQNLNFWSALQLYGYNWSTVTLGPPSIWTAGPAISSLPVIGTPANVLVPPESATFVWLLAFWALPVLSFASLLIVWRHPGLTLPGVGAALVGLLLALYASIPGLNGAIQAVASIPVVGSAIGTSLAVPDHFLTAIAASYLVLAPTSVYGLILWMKERPTNPVVDRGPDLATGSLRAPGRTRPFMRRIGPPAMILVVTAIVLFAGWQSVNGSFYPARADNYTFAGNGVPNSGAFTPFSVSNYTLETYSFLFAHGTSFNVYWPVGYGIKLEGYHAELPSASLPDFRTLLSSGLSFDVAPYLTAHGVRYVVVQDINGTTPPFYIPSIIPAQYHSNQYLYYFGLPTYNHVVSFLDQAPGMSLSLSVPGIRVFEVIDSPSLSYNASLLLDASTSQYLVAATYGLFNPANMSVAIAPSGGPGVPISYGTPGPGVVVLTPENLTAGYLSDSSLREAQLTSTLANATVGVRYSANSTVLPDSPPWGQNQSKGQYNTVVGGFSFSNWAGNFTTTITGGIVSVYSQRGATFTLDFGGPTTYNSRGIALANHSQVYEAGLNCLLSVSDPSQSTLSATFVAENATNQTTLAYDQYVPSGIPTAEGISAVNAVPNGTQYFTYRVGGSFTGFLNISYYNVSVVRSPLILASAFPLGSYLSLTNSSVPVTSAGDIANVVAGGNGTINGVALNRSRESILSLGRVQALNTTGSVQITGVILTPNEPISRMTGYYVVYNGADEAGILLRQGGLDYSPISTDFGTNLYILPGPGAYTLVAPSLEALQWGYLVVVGYILIMGAVAVGLWKPRLPRRLFQARQAIDRKRDDQLGRTAPLWRERRETR